MNRPATLRDVLGNVGPGSRMRTALDRIVQQGLGALIVIGWDEQMEALTSGGFRLSDVHFTPARLAELAKMDGAVILDDEGEIILLANAHILPDSSYDTDETGARFRTAQRLARQTGRAVLAVSEERGRVTVFFGDDKYELPTAAESLAIVNQRLQTLERFRQGLERSRSELTRLEIKDRVRVQDVITLLHRSELVRREAGQIDLLKIGLAGDGHLVELQQADLVAGVEELENLVLQDYLPGSADKVEKALAALAKVPTSELYNSQHMSEALGLEAPEAPARAMGYRLLDGVPRLPAAVRETLIEHFQDARKLQMASIAELSAVPGVGEVRAQEVRDHLDRMERNFLVSN